MAENLAVTGTTKVEKYESILPQISALIAGEENLIANLANVSAALKAVFGWFWVGFYLVDNDEELVLGPFQGPIACTRIRKGKGVCGTSWQNAECLIVDDVEKFPGHIACSAQSKSEIVIPLVKNENVFGVLDIDSDCLASFDESDKKYLEKICLELVHSL